MTIEPLIQKLCSYTDLSEHEKQALRDAVIRVDTINKRQDIISEGQRPEHVHLVLEGWACRYKLLETGKHHIMAYLLPGDLCDMYVTLLDEMDHSIRTLTPAKVASISQDKLNYIVDHCPRLARALFWSTLVDEAILREWLVNAGGRAADVRLAHIFCELLLRSRSAGLTQDNSFDLPLTQEELGETMGLTVVHTNRIVQRLRKEGLITLNSKRMVIEDWERLKAFGQFNPNYLHHRNVKK
ncbi:Crp/Fnr family transcriptional regulator [Halomonas sp. WWR20]